MKRATVGVLTVILCTAACGGNDKPDPTGVTATPAASATAAAVSLRESCPLVEASLPADVAPPAAQWLSYSQKLDTIAAAGDVETQNALSALQDAVDTLAGDPADGLPRLDARAALRDALDNLATRCKAVGSSALQ